MHSACVECRYLGEVIENLWSDKPFSQQWEQKRTSEEGCLANVYHLRRSQLSGLSCKLDQ